MNRDQTGALYALFHRLYGDEAEMGRIIQAWRDSLINPLVIADLRALGQLDDLAVIGAPNELDPQTLAYKAGRRDMALEILARMINPDELEEMVNVITGRAAATND